MKTFVPQGTQWYNKNIYYRKAHNGTMKTFVPQGTKWYNKNIYYRKAQMVQ
jgi:hypothetical protein